MSRTLVLHKDEAQDKEGAEAEVEQGVEQDLHLRPVIVVDMQAAGSSTTDPEDAAEVEAEAEPGTLTVRTLWKIEVASNGGRARRTSSRSVRRNSPRRHNPTLNEVVLLPRFQRAQHRIRRPSRCRTRSKAATTATNTTRTFVSRIRLRRSSTFPRGFQRVSGSGVPPSRIFRSQRTRVAFPSRSRSRSRRVSFHRQHLPLRQLFPIPSSHHRHRHGTHQTTHSFRTTIPCVCPTTWRERDEPVFTSYCIRESDGAAWGAV